LQEFKSPVKEFKIFFTIFEPVIPHQISKYL